MLIFMWIKESGFADYKNMGHAHITCISISILKSVVSCYV